MKFILRILLPLAISVGIRAAFAQPVVLDDFATFRQNADTNVLYSCDASHQNPANYSNCLWPGQPNKGPTICAVPTPGALVCNTNAGVPPFPPSDPQGLGFWLSTLSCDSSACYDLLASRMQSYIKSGAFSININRMRFSYKCSVDVAAYAGGTTGQHWLEVGTYVREPIGTVTNSGSQGQHYYHFFNSPSKANEWVSVEMNRMAQHKVGGDPFTNWREDPEWYAPTQTIPAHYYDGMTHLYWSSVNSPELKQQYITCSYGPFTLDTVSAGADAFVSGITGVYNPVSSKYDLSWNTAKMVPGGVTFDVNYATSSMRTNGWSTGTSAGSVTGQDSLAYTGVNFSTPVVARAPTMYVAIRPRMPAVTATVPVSAIQLSTTVEHFLTTGDAVTIAGVCANANGSRVVTVVDAFNFTLNGTSGPCSYAAPGGTIIATDNTRNFAELRIGGSNGPSSACDVNGDGSVNVLDVQFSVNTALGMSSCTPAFDLNGDGRCDLVDVQRVITASLGGVCRTGP